MSVMRFMSSPRLGGLQKSFSFDSSPGRAIAQAIGAGAWDERSYVAREVEVRSEEKIYEVSLRRAVLSGESPDTVHPLEVVGMITYNPPVMAPAR